MSWSRTAFRNAKSKLQDKHKVLEELTNQNKAENNEAIQGVRAKINSLLYHEKWLGDKDLVPFSCLLVIRTPNSSISGLANGDEKIISQEPLMPMMSGVTRKMVLHK